MKSKTPFIVIGATGLIVSIIIHLLLSTPFWNFFSFYTPWFTFLIIGLAQKKQARNLNKNQYIAAKKN
ncbi:hypothetical protein [uncultured Microscilla sp.]|uniref:hypothetical protein n=1 Tax=uncultured Microscilla sp. TaxID=432653 RepID=UPI002636A673|nr:hypothetical protein [uncultured Microscilla sp.]